MVNGTWDDESDALEVVTPKKAKMGKGPYKKKGLSQHSDDLDFSDKDSNSRMMGYTRHPRRVRFLSQPLLPTRMEMAGGKQTLLCLMTPSIVFSQII